MTTEPVDVLPSAPLAVALVNDYEIVVRGLQAMLQPFSDRLEVVELDVGGTPDRRADVALFDTFASRSNTLVRASTMINEGKVDHVVLYTWSANEAFLQRAAQVGVSAVISKGEDAPTLVSKIERVVNGDPSSGPIRSVRSQTVAGRLSERESEVLALLARGLRNSDIAAELFLSVDTVKTYVKRVFEKLGVANRTEAAMLAASFGLVASGR